MVFEVMTSWVVTELSVVDEELSDVDEELDDELVLLSSSLLEQEARANEAAVATVPTPSTFRKSLRDKLDIFIPLFLINLFFLNIIKRYSFGLNSVCRNIITST